MARGAEGCFRHSKRQLEGRYGKERADMKERKTSKGFLLFK